MEDITSKVIGKFTKILWQSNDKKTVIAAFLIIQNDAKNPVHINAYNSISITFKDNSFDNSKLTINEQLYELSLYKNLASRYPDSYLLNLDELIKLVENTDIKSDKYFYLSRLLRLPIFKNLVSSRAEIIANDLGDNMIDRILNDNTVHFNNFSIKEESWNEFVNIIKENTNYLKDLTELFKIDVSYNFYKIMLNYVDNLSEFIDEYFDNFYQYYFDADEDEKPRLSDIDKIAKKYNPESLKYKNSTYLYHFVQEYFFLSGNTRIKKDDFYNVITSSINDSNLATNIEIFESATKILLNEMMILELEYEDGIYYTTRDVVYMEKYIIKRLKNVEKKSIKKHIKYNENYKLDVQQKEAIKSALDDNLVLITGSPGTGKTLITNEIIDSFLSEFDEDDIAVLTPTGRATININSKQEKNIAQTIHSFLKWDIDNNKFYISEKNSLPIKVLIIDEFSMVSLELFYKLLKGISQYSLAKIILVGDKDQLPAIGSGYLIKDFIENEIFKTIKLTKIYRQAENYEIVNDALKINDGIMPQFEGKSSQFIECKRSLLKNMIISKLEELLDLGYDKKDIAILSPIYKHETGIDELNELLNDYFRKKENQEVVFYNDHDIAINDKVINLVNDSKLKVFNGEIGYISKFSYVISEVKKEKRLSHITVDFENDEKTVTYSRSDFFEKTYPAYCTSVHKYQGSEAKAVIVVLFSEAKRLLSKKLIYTAITRAQQYSVVIGEKEALKIGISNDDDSNRITNIKYLWLKQNIK
ncbi:ATP-dependent DNA helicase [Metamycoplasma gateae]|uniref:AAA family ATPase n=1 Tax=Metamycoplasma gateae TaxID=35769 RepID=A0ABZ2AGU8_9BACT|nr:AAA family ATPase [Metamycoplasma gateae]